MASFTRKSAWNNNGTFANTDLFWYAKAVGVMQSRQLDDPTSWWFFAAIHGHPWRTTTPPPNVPTTPLPSAGLRTQYWMQCQHGTWFFLPWHRGYLYAIENILREIIQTLDGPADWALPYWNYFRTGNNEIPSAFNLQSLPDGSQNPLFVKERYGPNHDGKVVIRLSDGVINQECQKNTEFIGGNSDGTSGKYGGAPTGFAHDFSFFGGLEWNPHNFVHGEIGGQSILGRGGLMSNPRTAALDPIFYLHHGNIDRMWAAWNITGTQNNPGEAAWIEGPTATGDRKFSMPKPDKSPWLYTPSMVDDLKKLNYTYDDLSLGVTLPLFSRNELRLLNFGLRLDEIKGIGEMARNANSELIGANRSSIVVDAIGAHTTLKLDSHGWNTVAESLNKSIAFSATEGPVLNNLPDEVFLQLEGIKGNEDSIVCSVSVNNQYVGHISLFGLSSASDKDSHSGGSGLTIRLDITKVVDKLNLNNALDVNSLEVLIQPVNIIAKGSELTIDRVSVYRTGQL